MNKGQQVEDCFQQMKISFSYIQQLECKHLTIPPIFFQESFDQKSVVASVKSNVYLRRLNETLWENTIVLHVDSKEQEHGEIFNKFKLTYVSIVSIEDVTYSNEIINEALVVKVSAFAFPFMRTILFNTTKDFGIPPVLLDPIDFEKINNNLNKDNNLNEEDK